MSDRITIRGIRAVGHHGVLASERMSGQEFSVDVVLAVDVRHAAASDDLAATVDYSAVAEAVHEEIVGEPVDLIETLAERIARRCLADVLVDEVVVVVHKPHAPIAVPFDDVTLTITRRRLPVVIALGSNLGDRGATLAGAVAGLRGIDGLWVRAISPVVETDPVGGPEQPDYLNAVVLADTVLTPGELLAATQGVEQHWHRTREVRWGPRTLDIDLIAVGDEVSESASLTLPHPRAHERAFVLVPWLAVDPRASLPGRGLVSDLLADLDVSGVRSSDIRLESGEGSA